MANELAADVLRQDGPEPQVNPEVSQPAIAEKVGEEHDPQGTETDGENESPEQKQKRLGGWQRKIQKLERENETLRELALRSIPAKPAEPVVVTKEDAEPKEEDFADLGSYMRAMAQHSAAKAVREYKAAVEKEATEREQKAKQEQAQKTWLERSNKAADKYDDYHEVTNNPALPINQPMTDAILAEENGADVFYHLGKHPEEAARISKLSPVQSVLEIGKLAARLAPKNEGHAPDVSNAPTPISPVRKPSTAGVKSPEDMSFKEYTAYRAKQIADRNK